MLAGYRFRFVTETELKDLNSFSVIYKWSPTS